MNLEGTGDLASTSETKGSFRPDKSGKRGKKTGTPENGAVGTTLRSVYQQTVNEDIPSELLDLLGKLN